MAVLRAAAGARARVPCRAARLLPGNEVRRRRAGAEGRRDVLERASPAFGTGLSFPRDAGEGGRARQGRYEWEPTLFFTDPPAHRLARRCSRRSRPGGCASSRASSQRLCDEIVDGLDTSAPSTSRRRSRFELPTMVIGEALGVEREDRPRFRLWADAVVTRLGEQLSEEQDIALIGDYVDAQHYFAAEIARRRSEPRDDLLSDLVHAAADPRTRSPTRSCWRSSRSSPSRAPDERGPDGDGDAPPARAPRGPRPVPRRAGVHRRDDRGDAAPAEPDPGLVPAGDAGRRALGRDRPEGRAGARLLASANRDEDKWECPAEFHTDRDNIKDHVAFGWGPHFCVGASLARAEARIAIETMLGDSPTSAWRQAPKPSPPQPRAPDGGQPPSGSRGGMNPTNKETVKPWLKP